MSFSPHVRSARGRRRDEAGGTAVAMSLVVTVLVGMSSFVVDVGLQRVLRQDMQTLSDVVALDMARDMGGRTRSAIEADPSWQSAIAHSIARNTAIGETPDLKVTLGRIEPATQKFVEVPASEVPTAIKVAAGSTVGYTMRQGSGRSGANAGDGAGSAIAIFDPTTCFVVNSYLAQFESGSAGATAVDALVGGILKVKPSAMSAGGMSILRTATVPIAGLTSKLGVGTAGEMDTVVSTTAGFLHALSASVAATGTASSASQAAFITELAKKAELMPTKAETFKLTDLFDVADDALSASMNVDVNVFDLVMGAVLTSVKGKSVDLEVAASVGALTTVTAKATIAQAPRIGCGTRGAQSSSASIVIDISAKINGNAVATPVKLGPQSETSLHLKIGSSTGTLTATQCPSDAAGSPAPTAESATITVDTGLVGDLYLTFGLGLKGLADKLNLSSMGLEQNARFDAALPVLLSARKEPVTFTFPPTGLPAPTKVAGVTELGLESLSIEPTYSEALVKNWPLKYQNLVDSTSIKIPLLGNILSWMTDTLKSVYGSWTGPDDPTLAQTVDPALDITESAVDPALTAVARFAAEAVGASFGGSEVKMLSRVACDAPRLVG